MSKQSTLGTQVLEMFAAQLQGRLIRPSDPDYDAARRVWNGIIDRYPAVIARCASVDDVVSSVNFARKHQLAVAVRGGGHSVAGHGTVNDGLVIDLSALNRVDVYPQTRIAAVQGGATWGEVDAVTQAYGLAAPGGVVSDTGIAGLTLGGGFGWLRNKHGLSCDNLVAAEVVTADGRIVYATENENRELLWGLRGGGGNFGIVTTFEFRLHPVGPEVMFVFAMHNAEDERMKRAIQFYRDYSASAPDEVSSVAVIGIIPPTEHFAAEIHGKRFILFGAMYAGDPKRGQAILQPLIDFDLPLHDLSGVIPYVQAQKLFDEDYPKGMRYYWKSVNLSRLEDEVINRIVEYAHTQVSPYSTVDLWHIGGEVARTSSQHSAFFGRQAAFLLNPEANWQKPEDDAANIVWVRDFVAAMQPFSDGSRYLNFAGFHEEGSATIQASFGEQYERLVALKNRYDPANFFRMNQNIEPATNGKEESA